jgi:hypothetical protein
LKTKRRGFRYLASINKRVIRLSCFACEFTGPLRPLGNLREEDDVCFHITRQSLERASLRILARRFHKSKNTILKIIHRVTSELPDSIALQQKFLPLWSGILVFDGKVVRVYDKLSTMLKGSSLSEDELRWMNKMRWLVGVDLGTGDLPHYDLATSESKIDLVIYFKALKALNYPLIALVCDGNENIPEAAKFVFGDEIVIQLCTRHFMEGLRKLLPEEEHPKRREKLEKLLSLIQSVIEANGHRGSERLFVGNEYFRKVVTSSSQKSISRVIRTPQKRIVCSSPSS